MKGYKRLNLQNDVQLNTKKEHKYFKYFLAPAITILLLLCILMKVNFKSEVYQIKVLNKDSEIPPQKTYKKSILKRNTFHLYNAEFEFSAREILWQKFYTTVKSNRIRRATKQITLKEEVDSENQNANVDESIENHEVNVSTEILKTNASDLMNATNLLAPAISCQEYKSNCTLYCLNGSVSFLDDDLDQLQSICLNNDLSLIVTKCEFNFGILQQSFFYGYFSLGYLSINECNLQTIKTNAFTHNNVKNLHTLILSHNQLSLLQHNTFDGLTSLKIFEFIQIPLSSSFNGEGFLTALAKVLTKATIQPKINDSVALDPSNWWLDLQMDSLISLDISNTNLYGTLNSKTFKPFSMLQYLILTNCNLRSITAPVFDFISSDFKYLDLRFNHLHTLDHKFLQKLIVPGIELDLNLNEWHCECDNEMMQYFIDHEVKLTKENVCTAPEIWQQLNFAQVIENCKETSTVSSTSTTFSTSFDPINNFTSTVTSTTTSKPRTEPSTTTTSQESSISSRPDKISTTTEANIQNLTSLKCYLNENRTEFFWSNIIKPVANFSLYINSSTSLTVVVQTSEFFENYFIIYFTNYSDYHYAYNFEILKSETQSGLVQIYFIQDLLPFTVYEFCLVLESTRTVSPFDCKSYFMVLKKYKTDWLVVSDKVWFISLNSVAAVALFLSSSFAVYTVLRLKPHWLLKRNKEAPRVLVVHKKASCTPKRLHSSPLSQISTDYLRALPPLQYVDDDDDDGVIENVVYNTQHVVPTFRAPTLPPSVEICYSSSSRELTKQNIDYPNLLDIEPDYQAIDYYETILT